MRFVYSFKTSDGVRHEKLIRAWSKEQVFETLRREGIRPIKVVRKGADVMRIGGLLACGVLVGVLLLKLLPLVVPSSQDPTTIVNCPNELVEKVDGALAQFRETISNYDTEDLRFETKKEISPVLRRVRQSAEIVDYYRTFLHGIFGFWFSSLEGKNENGAAIRRYYGVTMSELDVAEEKLRSREYVLTLLQDNWGDWRYESLGNAIRVVFRSQELQREYDFHSSDTDVASLRWRRDFGPTQKPVARR